MRVSFNPAYTCNKKKAQPLNQNPSFGNLHTAIALDKKFVFFGTDVLPRVIAEYKIEKVPLAKRMLADIIKRCGLDPEKV